MNAPEAVQDARVLIVVAWTTTRTRSVSARVVETIEEPHACTWLLAGQLADVERARLHLERYQDRTRGAVYTFPLQERDPLGLARERVLLEPA